MPNTIKLTLLFFSLGIAPVCAQDADSDNLHNQALNSLSQIHQKLERHEIDVRLIQEQEQLLEKLKLIIKSDGSSQASQSQTSRSNPDAQDPMTSPAKESIVETTSTGTPIPNGEDALPNSPLLRPELADAVWGHLPPREQKELVRTFNERYLPSYEDQIRQYFEKLSGLSDKAQ